MRRELEPERRFNLNLERYNRKFGNKIHDSPRRESWVHPGARIVQRCLEARKNQINNPQLVKMMREVKEDENQNFHPNR